MQTLRQQPTLRSTLAVLVCIGLLLRPLLLPLHLLVEEHSYGHPDAHATAHHGHHGHTHPHSHPHVHLHDVDDDGESPDGDGDPEHPPHPVDDHADGADELLPAPPPPVLLIAICLPDGPHYDVTLLRPCGRLCPPTLAETPRPPPRRPAQPRAPPAIA